MITNTSFIWARKSVVDLSLGPGQLVAMSPEKVREDEHRLRKNTEQKKKKKLMKTKKRKA